MNELIKQFLKFRKQFTKRQWQEINHLVELQMNSKAAKLQLDDQDIQEITKLLERKRSMTQLKLDPELLRTQQQKNCKSCN